MHKFIYFYSGNETTTGWISFGNSKEQEEEEEENGLIDAIKCLLRFWYFVRINK